MGGCLSKKSTNSASPGELRRSPPEQTKSTVQVEKKKVEEHTVKREVFIIKHRKSQDIERKPNEEKGEAKKVIEITESCPTVVCNNASNGGLGVSNGNGIFVATPVRTSNCTKEEVDAILIQCGRLSRSSSTRKPRASSGSGENNGSIKKGKNFSGSKRSYDFDNENGNEDRNADRKQGVDFEENLDGDDDNEVVGEGSDRHRQRQRQSRMVGSPSKGRRRTPSRERDLGQRSGSRERSSGNGGRRVSRSPGKRSESPVTSSSGVSGANLSASNANSSTNGRPGKMVSVPATVSSLSMGKSNNAERNETISTAAIKRIQVKRNAGSEAAAVVARTAASPRARSPSPARTSVKILSDNQNGSSNHDQQQHMSLSRSNSRKAEVSPYRRNPLGEIDKNVHVDQIHVQALKAPSNVTSQAPIQKETVDHSINRGVAEKNVKNITCTANKQQQSLGAEETKEPQAICSNVVVNMVASGNDCFKSQSMTRTRSSRLSRDLDICAEDFSDPGPSSYAALLLEDIQNFHQKSNPTYTLPACLSKARSIVEAVADLNSGTKSNFSYDKQEKPTASELSRSNGSLGFDPLAGGKKGLEGKGPFMQSEVAATDDLMEPTYQKYVTVRRGSLGEENIEEQESSGSNSFVGGQQHCVSSSPLEPDSTESTSHWTSSRSCSREDNRMPLGCQRQAISEPGIDSEDALRRFNGNKRESDQQQSGIGRGRLGSR